MEIFFVRHGETSGNLARRHQTDHSPLTFAGEEQVKKVAQKIRSYEPTHIVTSPLKRAMDSCIVIADECAIIPETSGLFAELRRPQHLYGHFHFTLSSLIYYVGWFFGLKISKWRDGESYNDLLLRIKEAKEYLATFPPEARVIVVSHCVYINFFVVHLCDEKKMSLFQAVKTFLKLATMKNTQITHILFNPESKTGTCSWIVDM